jgi:asparagine synthase (glutamine-hydrolysing)
VALSGDGGDEMFGGYNRYFLGARIRARFGSWPQVARRAAADAIRVLSPRTWDALATVLGGVLPDRLRHPQAGDRLHKLAGVLEAASEAEMYRLLCSQWRAPARVVEGGHEPPTLFGAGARDVPRAGFVQRMMYEDARTYLPDDILVKVDRAAMAVSLECRAPFVDHRVAAFAWRLPLRLKVRGAEGKWALRQVAYRHVPRELLQRPKQGFGVPIDAWLRGPLREWAGDLLAEERLRREGFLNPDIVTRTWREHLGGGRNWQYLLWGALMFQAWVETERDAGRAAPPAAAVA